MDSKEFLKFAAAMTEYIANYMDNIRDRRVLPTVEPGYLRPLIPTEAPKKGEKWTDVMADIERVVMPGITHWQSPHFHAYYPITSSFPAIVADMLSGGIACVGFSWVSQRRRRTHPYAGIRNGLVIARPGRLFRNPLQMASPVYTELEVVMLDWLGKMLALPEAFLSSTPNSHGGGIIQGTSSEATLVALLGAKAKAVYKIKQMHPEWADSDIVAKLVIYASEQAHCAVERAALLGAVKLRLMECDERFRMRGVTLRKAIDEDKAAGLFPFMVVGSLGTASVCSFDVLEEIGPICEKEELWLHVDAAYAGSAFICPEFRYLMNGVEYADSFNFNPHKWMLVNFDCAVMWFRNPGDVINAFRVDPVYLRHERQHQVQDNRHWQIPLGIRLRSLKIWFVLRLLGKEYLQTFIRTQIGLAHEFRHLLLTDPKFEIIGDVIMGLVCFRLKGSNQKNEKLLKKINENGKIHLVPSVINGVYFLRFAICSTVTQSSDIHYAWDEIKSLADQLSEEL